MTKHHTLSGLFTNAIIKLIFDATILGLTLFYTLGAYRLQRSLKAFEGGSLISFLLWNGENSSF